MIFFFFSIHSCILKILLRLCPFQTYCFHICSLLCSDHEFSTLNCTNHQIFGSFKGNLLKLRGWQTPSPRLAVGNLSFKNLLYKGGVYPLESIPCWVWHLLVYPLIFLYVNISLQIIAPSSWFMLVAVESVIVCASWKTITYYIQKISS